MSPTHVMCHAHKLPGKRLIDRFDSSRIKYPTFALYLSEGLSTGNTHVRIRRGHEDNEDVQCVGFTSYFHMTNNNVNT